MNYRLIEPITHSIPENKQSAKRYYGKHQYFTTRAWNVVQEYINHFSNIGDTVLDPFGGSGVTAIEALILGRRSVHIDTAPISTFLAETTALAPVDLSKLGEAFEKIKSRCKKQLYIWHDASREEIYQLENPYWYPKNVLLPKNADVDYVHELFTPRQLISLSFIHDSIMSEKSDVFRKLLLLTFSATLIKTNRTFVSAKGRKPSRGGASIFSMYRYYVPEHPVELNVWDQFEMRFKGIQKAKKETNSLIGNKYNSENIKIVNGSATKILEYIDAASVDYIFTDPPYGAHIAYLDLSRMFHAWLQFDVSNELIEAEAIEGGDQGKTKEDYQNILNKSFDQMYGALKDDRWLSLVFAHKDISYWNAIVNSAQSSGFEYVNTVSQNPQTIWSMHKKKNPLTVLAGNLILNFRKVKSPKSIAITRVGADTIQIIKNTAELAIVRNEGKASTDHIVSEIIIKLLENGLLSEVNTKVGDIAPLLQEYFIFNEIDEYWYLPQNSTIGQYVPLKDRIRFYILDLLKRAERNEQELEFDDILKNILPQLINGITPDDNTILDVLNSIAYSPDSKHWAIKEKREGYDTEQTSLFPSDPGQVSLPIVLNPASETGLTHTSIIYRLAKMGLVAGYSLWIGKNEQRESFNGEKLSELSIKSLPAYTNDEYVQRNIEQIDIIWINKLNIPEYAFEVEHSTTIKSALQRFIEILKVESNIGDNLIILAPTKRKKKVVNELTKSHFIGHPLYMENKVRYGYYSDFVKLYDNFSKAKIKRDDITKGLDTILNKINISRDN